MRKSISRYVEATGPEAETQPGSHGRVLRNLLGLASKRALDLAEAQALVQAQEKWYRQLTQQTRFSAKLICQMHRDWLEGIYSWAGQYRTVELAKAGFRWPPAERVAANMATFERTTLKQATPCLPQPLDELTVRLAAVHSELLLIHPFRDGNGRLARWLADIMAAQAGYPTPAYGFSGKGSTARREEYLEGLKKGYRADYRPSADFFLKAILRRGSDKP